MIIKQLCDDFFKLNGFRIHVETTDDFNSQGRTVQILHSDLHSRVSDNLNVSVARDEFNQTLRANKLAPYVHYCCVLDADGEGLKSHARGVKRVRTEYKQHPKWPLYQVHLKLELLGKEALRSYLEDDTFPSDKFDELLSDLNGMSKFYRLDK